MKLVRYFVWKLQLDDSFVPRFIPHIHEDQLLSFNFHPQHTQTHTHIHTHTNYRIFIIVLCYSLRCWIRIGIRYLFFIKMIFSTCLPRMNLHVVSTKTKKEEKKTKEKRRYKFVVLTFECDEANPNGWHHYWIMRRVRFKFFLKFPNKYNVSSFWFAYFNDFELQFLVVFHWFCFFSLFVECFFPFHFDS